MEANFFYRSQIFSPIFLDYKFFENLYLLKEMSSPDNNLMIVT